VFKVHRYEPDYPGLASKDLSPKGVIELPASERGKTGMDRADAGPNDRPGSNASGNRPNARDDQGDNRPPRPSDSTTPRGNEEPRGGQGQGGQGQGGQRGGPGGMRILPRATVDQLKLTSEQQQQIDELEKLVNTKLQQILTPQQQQILQDARPPRRGEGGSGTREPGPGNPPPPRDNEGRDPPPNR